MNPLLQRLASLRRQVRILDGWIGICALGALTLGVGVFVGVADFYLHIPSLVRAGLLVALLVSTAYLVYRLIVEPFTNPYDDLSLALLVEEAYPELNDALASTVQFLQQTPEENARIGGSEAMREHTVQDALKKVDACDFGKVLADKRQVVLPAIFGALYQAIAALFTPRKALALLADLWQQSKATFAGALIYASLIAAVSVLSLNLYHNNYVGIGFWRFVEPFGQHTWTTITVAKLRPVGLLDQDGDVKSKYKPLDPKDADKVAVNRPYMIQVHLTGQMPKSGEARVEVVGQSRSDKTIKLVMAENKRSASFETAIDMTSIPQKFKFRILANDGTFPPRSGTWHEVNVLPPPKLVALANGKDSPQITVIPPKYTDLPTRHLDPGDWNVKLYAGSTVILRAKADRKLEEAWIEYRPEDGTLLPAAALAVLGHTTPLSALGAAAGTNPLWGRIPAKFEADGETFSVTFMPIVSAGYVLHIRDFDQLDYRAEGKLNVQIDPEPKVMLVAPAKPPNAEVAVLEILPIEEVKFKFQVTDPEFAIKSVFVEYRHKAPDGQWIGEPKRTVLYDASAFGKLVPKLSARLGQKPAVGAHPLMGTFPFPVKVPEFRLRHQKLDIEMVWALRSQFQDGDIVVVEICADDFCDIYPSRAPGRSYPVELRVVSKFKLNHEVERASADILQKIRKIIEVQEYARDKTKATRGLDMIKPSDIDRFTDDAIDKQKDVKDRVGDSVDTGLRQDVRKLTNVLERNHLTDSAAYRQLKKIAGALKSVADGELPKIGTNLNETREKMRNIVGDAKREEGAKEEAKKNDPKAQKKLDDTVRLQESVIKSLKELIQDLDPQAKMQDLTNKNRQMIQKQRALADDLELQKAIKEANDQNKELTPEERKIAENEFKKQIEKNALAQEDLANQMQKLVQEMRAAKAEYEKLGDQRNAKKLDAAIKNAEPPDPKKIPPKKDEKEKPISEQMRAAADKLKDKPRDVSNEAVQDQKDIVKRLEKGLDALEGNTFDSTKDDLKDRKDIENKLNNLAREMKQLRDETKKVQNEKDEMLKKEQEKKLAEKMEALQDKIEKTRRELARLNEQQAAEKLKAAAEKLDQAKAELEQGGDPGQKQKEAAQEINQAKKDVQQAQEELQRELLVKMKDQIEGLKIRQAASLERSEKLHVKILEKKSWMNEYLDTMDGNIDAQKGIAEETDNLKDKLKEAKVFHAILGKAKESMDIAAETMEIRRKEGQDRRYFELGEKFDAKELKEEVEWHDTTVMHQKRAVNRLDNLLDSIKEEIDRIDKRKKNKKPDPMDPDNPPPEPKEEKGGFKNQDGIPPMAQLKALRAWQLDVNNRTEDFDKRHPNRDDLNDKQKAELADISREQTRIHELFQEILPRQPDAAPPMEEKKGDAK
ncbi:MAG: hypothetical protein HYR84_04945 [Planctomycetes bacterium]|nr:hypothetical protein [Planctomycetota bacterium]